MFHAVRLLARFAADGQVFGQGMKKLRSRAARRCLAVSGGCGLHALRRLKPQG